MQCLQLLQYFFESAVFAGPTQGPHLMEKLLLQMFSYIFINIAWSLSQRFLDFCRGKNVSVYIVRINGVYVRIMFVLFVRELIQKPTSEKLICSPLLSFRSMSYSLRRFSPQIEYFQHFVSLSKDRNQLIFPSYVDVRSMCLRRTRNRSCFPRNLCAPFFTRQKS